PASNYTSNKGPPDRQTSPVPSTDVASAGISAGISARIGAGIGAGISAGIGAGIGAVIGAGIGAGIGPGRYPSRRDVTGDERSAWTAGMRVATVASPRSAVATSRNDSGSVGATPKRSDRME